MRFADVTGQVIELAAPPKRVISLVPSVTETLFAIRAGASLVGRTRYCISPDPDVRAIERVGGTKDPDLERIQALRPDLVLANREENRKPDIEALRARGIPVYVEEPVTVTEGLETVSRLGQMLAAEEAADAIVRRGVQVLSDVKARLADLEAQNALRLTPRKSVRPRVVAFIWKDPWMVVGSRTFMGDMIETLGGEHLYKTHAQRYFAVEPGEVAAANPDILLFPDEPYSFSEPDLIWWQEHFAAMGAVRHSRLRPCSGQDLAWYGARIPGALARLQPALAW